MTKKSQLSSKSLKSTSIQVARKQTTINTKCNRDQTSGSGFRRYDEELLQLQQRRAGKCGSQMAISGKIHKSITRGNLKVDTQKCGPAQQYPSNNVIEVSLAPSILANSSLSKLGEKRTTLTADDLLVGEADGRTFEVEQRRREIARIKSSIDESNQFRILDESDRMTPVVKLAAPILRLGLNVPPAVANVAISAVIATGVCVRDRDDDDDL